MGSFKMAGMTLRSLFKKPETLQYPFEKKPAYPGQKGHIVNDSQKCILCGICDKTCPVGCIQVDKAERLWKIEPFMCIQCGSCVRACPVNCLTMDGEPTSISVEKFATDVFVPEKEKKEKKESVTED